MQKTDFPESTMKQTPSIHKTAFIAEGAKVMGDARIGENASIWYNAVIRADIQTISIGRMSNIQDGCVLHVENDRACIVGNYVTVGHNAILHGCTIEDGCLIGMGAIILNGAVLKKGCVIGAGAIVRENEVVESGTLWVGVPAKQVKDNLHSAYETNIKWAEKYAKLADVHKKSK